MAAVAAVGARPLAARLAAASRRAATSTAVHAAAADTPAVSSPAQRPPRFYLPASLRDAGAGAVLRLPPEEARHATKTLRLREGDRLELCDGRGWVVQAELAGADKAGAVVHTVAAPEQVALRGWQWEVACACGSLKGGRSDWLVEKAAELGAASLTPLLTQRSPSIGSGGDDERPAAQGGKRAGRRRGGGDDEDGEAAASGREGRWARVATAAMKQCLRPYALVIHPPTSVEQLCQRIQAADAALVGVGPDAPALQAVAAALQAPPGRLGRGILCIGPEGDWTPEELEQLLAAGAQPVALGDLRLRAETAAIALLAYLRMQLP
ncbi:ribosomal RNA small subunit methyltransferase E [Chlorella sorokiniana]|uniref:16S rRNA (uracil(1498)-N(3))-methyltransferase n=1 Tax=Chlorella sorokiniana TaxID=3076 RepID=A0A2P6TXS0_CHLSO|nr:ribosomal RNA small subunit methyltransferase E [Chlorella sorokiniana]|eukprot:PRW58851.1 ribosomal RNA small subunit methyltransferase E [Chlorella sorokiniana]